ncbi:MAG: amidase, partial [Candidatus Bathyarchaeia archaeon]
YIAVLKKESLQAAKNSDEEINSGKYRGPLHGIPVGVKDVIASRGAPTTAASKILADNVTDYDSTAVERLKQAGAILIGKMNLHEFAYGASTEESHFGPCHNPWNTEFISGGSSGGSGASVAASICYGALGTDTGGSIRIPAAFCGIVGFKATYGRVSRHGVIPVSWSLDHIGPMTRTVEDAALMLDAIAGHDSKDPTTSKRPVTRYSDSPPVDMSKMRAGVLRKYMDECISEESQKAVQKAIDALEGMGVKVEDLSIPNIEDTAVVTNILMACEATTYHEDWLKTRPNDYSPTILTRLQVGYFYTATQYIKALKLRAWFRREFARAFKKVDVVLSPTCPITPFKIGQETIDVKGVKTDPRAFLAMYTRIYDLTGLPAVTLPCGFTTDGLPIGFQIAGKPFDESTLFGVANAYENSQPWKDRHPNI